MNDFAALEPWHKVQAIILLIIAAVMLYKFIAMLYEWWQEYKQQTAGIEEWEEEQHNKKADRSQH